MRENALRIEAGSMQPLVGARRRALVQQMSTHIQDSRIAATGCMARTYLHCIQTVVDYLHCFVIQ